MRTTSSPVQDVIEGPVVPHAMLVKILFASGTQTLCSAPINITWGADTYLAAGQIGQIEPVVDAVSEAPNLNLSLSGAGADQIATALAEPVRGVPIYIRLAQLDPADYTVLAAPLMWSGTLDRLTFELQPDGTSTIGVSAEHAGNLLARNKPFRYTDADQQLAYPGDTCLRFLASQANHADVWPAASWGRK